MSSKSLLSVDNVGSESFSLTKASWKSFGRVTFSREDKAGMLSCGAVMFPKTLRSFTLFTMDWIALFTSPMSPWIADRMVPNVLVRKLLIYVWRERMSILKTRGRHA